MSKYKLYIEVEKDGWISDITFLKEDNGFVLIVVGEEFEITNKQAVKINNFLNNNLKDEL